MPSAAEAERKEKRTILTRPNGVSLNQKFCSSFRQSQGNAPTSNVTFQMEDTQVLVTSGTKTIASDTIFDQGIQQFEVKLNKNGSSNRSYMCGVIPEQSKIGASSSNYMGDTTLKGWGMYINSGMWSMHHKGSSKQGSNTTFRGYTNEEYHIGIIVDMNEKTIEWKNGGLSGATIMKHPLQNATTVRPAITIFGGGKGTIIGSQGAGGGPDSWSDNTKGPQVTLSGQGLLASVGSPQFAWNTVYGTHKAVRGLHMWKVRLDSYVPVSGGNTWWGIVGVATSTSNGMSYLSNHGLGVGYILQGFRTDGQGHKPYGRPCKSGDELIVILDMSNMTLKFKLNGEALGTSHRNLPKGEYRLAVSLGHRDTQVQLIGHKVDESKCAEYFDSSRVSGTVSIDSSGMSASFSTSVWQVAQSPQVLRPGTGIYKWQAKIERLETRQNKLGLAIGLQAADAAYSPSGCIGLSAHLGGWALFLGTGQRATGNVTKGYADPFRAGDVVGVCYNSNNGELSFSRNGAPLGVAFVVPRQAVRPSFSGIYGQELSCTQELMQPLVDFNQSGLENYLFEDDGTVRKLTEERSTLFDPVIEEGIQEYEIRYRDSAVETPKVSAAEKSAEKDAEKSAEKDQASAAAGASVDTVVPGAASSEEKKDKTESKSTVESSNTEVKLNNYVGVVDATAEIPLGVQLGKVGLAYSGGFVFNNGRTRRWGIPCNSPNDVVRVRIDMENKSIQFTLNGQEFPIVPDFQLPKVVKLAVSMQAKNSRLSVRRVQPSKDEEDKKKLTIKIDTSSIKTGCWQVSQASTVFVKQSNQRTTLRFLPVVKSGVVSFKVKISHHTKRTIQLLRRLYQCKRAQHDIGEHVRREQGICLRIQRTKMVHE